MHNSPRHSSHLSFLVSFRAAAAKNPGSFLASLDQETLHKRPMHLPLSLKEELCMTFISAMERSALEARDPSLCSG